MASIGRYSTARGNRYRVRYRLPNGQQTDKRGFATRKAAQTYAESLQVAIHAGHYVAPSSGRVLLLTLGLPWLLRQHAHMKPSSIRSLESAWRVQVEPRWGAVRIDSIRHTQVQDWIAELTHSRKRTIVVTAHGVLSRILDDAVRDHLLATNPARGIKLPRRRERRRVYLTHRQVHMLAHEAGRYESLVLLLAYTGLRWGEAAGLHVEDIDFERSRVRTHRNAVQVGSSMILGTLKGHSARVVPLPDFVVAALRRTCAGRVPDAIIWPSRSGGYLGPPSSHDSWLSGAVHRCQHAAKLNNEDSSGPTPFPTVSAHALRHTAASLAIGAGANVKAVQRMLGHASAAMTLDVYAELFDDDLASVAEKMSQAVGNLWANQPT